MGMARFDDFSLDELLELRRCADGFESWYDEFYEALERRAAADGIEFPEPVPLPPTSGVEINVLMEKMVEAKISFGNPFERLITHNWGL